MTEPAVTTSRPKALAGQALRVVATDAGLHTIEFCPQDAAAEETRGSAAAAEMLARAMDELDRYFAGERLEFTTPLDLVGTPFQRRVWRALTKIPYGETLSYADVAAKVRCRRGVRAVGQAVGRNPVPIVVPCHRVIGKDRRLTGFSGGLTNKVLLLELEGLWIGTAASTAERVVLREPPEYRQLAIPGMG